MAVERGRFATESVLDPNWAMIQDGITDFNSKDKYKVNLAYRTARLVYAKKKRRDGAQAIDHSTSLALILLDECHIKDVDMLCAALLHDTLEDTLLFGDPRKIGHTRRTEKARKELSKHFSPETAEMTIALSEPAVDGMEILDKFTAKTMKYDQLQIPSLEALELYGSKYELFMAKVVMIKIVDRLHNSRTFHPNPEKGRETPVVKINETVDILWNIFLTAAKQYPEETADMLGKIKQEILQQCRNYGLTPPVFPDEHSES